MFTDRQLDNRMKKIKELDEQIKEMKDLMEALKEEVTKDLEEKKESEHDTGSFVIRWQTISQKRLDSTTLKSELPDVYAKYAKESSYKKFTYKAS